MHRLELSDNAKKVLEKRYLHRDESGKLIETPHQMFERVANKVASVEKRDRDKWAKKFLDMMAYGRFMPNSPTLMNAGKDDGQLSACFVLPVEDDLDGIFDSLKNAAKIHQSGGGTGFSFSRLRSAGSTVHSSHGVASGPVSFMKIFDTATETIKQGGARRGANMGILRVDHPDILDFIRVKKDQVSIQNFNLSVAITDQFMEAVAQGKDFDLTDPVSKQVVRSLAAKSLFNEICQSAWECGDPGLVFIDRINQFNPTPQVGEMESTNPCGEQPLLPFESCNLGSLNLAAYVKKDTDSKPFFDWDWFKKEIHLAVRFLDNVVDANHYPIKPCKDITLRNRKIGLGVMGLADLFLKLRIPYASDEALSLGEELMQFLNQEAKDASRELAVKKKPFTHWRNSLWDQLGFPKMRNATVSTVAPTGTISIIAGASSGIEPIFSAVYYRNVLDGEELLEVHPVVKQILQEKGHTLDGVDGDKIDRLISQELGEVWQVASDIPVESHVKMQAVFQKHCDSAVSKTINLPNSARPEDISQAYLLAYQLGCKGITVYRDGSKNTQVLNKGTPQTKAEVCEICE